MADLHLQRDGLEIQGKNYHAYEGKTHNLFSIHILCSKQKNAIFLNSSKRRVVGVECSVKAGRYFCNKLPRSTARSRYDCLRGHPIYAEINKCHPHEAPSVSSLL